MEYLADYVATMSSSVKTVCCSALDLTLQQYNESPIRTYLRLNKEVRTIYPVRGY